MGAHFTRLPRRLPQGSEGRHLDREIGDEDGKRHYQALGTADDILDADGLTALSFSRARAEARRFFETKARQLAGHAAPQVGPYKVSMVGRLL